MVVTKTSLSQKLIIATTTITAFLTGLVTVVAAWWVWGTDPTYFAAMKIEQHRAWYADGDVFVFRASKVTKPLNLVISRDLSKVGGEYKLSMPDFRLHVREGEHEVVRRIDVPYTLEPGVWELKSVVTWRANPLRTVKTPLPVVTFSVPE